MQRLSVKEFWLFFPELARMLSASDEREERYSKMIGHIRTNERCPKCGKAFVEVPGTCLICPEHLTTPKRCFIDFFYTPAKSEGYRVKLYTDKLGLVLDSYARCLYLLEEIDGEIKHNCFNPEKYDRKKRKEYLVTKLLDKFLNEKVNAKRPSGESRIAPSYEKDYRRNVAVHKEYWLKHDRDVRDVHNLQVHDYREYLLQKYPGDKTAANMFDHFKTFMRWCMLLEIITGLPAFEPIDYAAPSIDVFSMQQVKDIFHNYIPALFKPIVGFLCLHPCRPGEARAIQLKKINLSRNSILIDATFSKEKPRSKRKGKKANRTTFQSTPSYLTGSRAGRRMGVTKTCCSCVRTDIISRCMTLIGCGRGSALPWDCRRKYACMM